MLNTLQIIANQSADIEGDINSLSIKTILIASLILVVLLLIASRVVNNEKLHTVKTPLFVLIAATIIFPSLLLIGSTIYINTISESKGPVHWHTDIEFWVCGEEIEYRDPYEFLSNKVGTATYHEHDDKRIHLEGVVIEKDYDASLEKFMDVTDGYIDSNSLTIPTNENPFENDTDGDKTSGNQDFIRSLMKRDELDKPAISVQSGQDCGDGQTAEVQAYLFRYNKNDNTYSQEKLAEPERYIMRDESVVPPGDCVIVEFGPARDYTDKLCQQYGVRDTVRCTQFGVSEYNPELCNAKEVRETTNDEVMPLLHEEPTVPVEQEEGEL